jgi:hypothetical protein
MMDERRQSYDHVPRSPIPVYPYSIITFMTLFNPNWSLLHIKEPGIEITSCEDLSWDEKVRDGDQRYRLLRKKEVRGSNWS